MKEQTLSIVDSWRSMLDAKPVQNTAARVVENRQKCVTVYVKKEKPSYFVPPLSWVVPFNAERRVSLDAIGTQLWRWCDGTRTVEDIVDRFKDHYGLSFHESRAAVTGYLKMLIQRGVLAIVMQEQP